MTLVIVYNNAKLGTKDIYIFQIKELLHLYCGVKGLSITFLEDSKTASDTPSDVEVDMDVKEAMKHADNIVEAFCCGRAMYEIVVNE